MTPKDINVCEVHDCSTIAELIAIEDLGFFKPGEGHRAIAEGRPRVSGRAPSTRPADSSRRDTRSRQWRRKCGAPNPCASASLVNERSRIVDPHEECACPSRMQESSHMS